jgi:glycosyltransferase involved in cell wall biosynthesis
MDEPAFDGLPPRILLVSTATAFGGTEQVLLDSARRLVAAGERVEAWVAHGSGGDALVRALREAGVRSERWGEVGASGAHFGATVRRLRERPPAVVHLHLPWPHANAWFPVAARLAGVPAVVTTEHLLFPERHARDDLRKRFTGRFVDRAIAVSHAIGDTLVEAWGYHASRVRVIPNGVDLVRFSGPDPERRARGRERLDVAPDAPLIGSLGRLEEQKGFAALVRAAGRLASEFPRLRVAIAGEGALAGDLAAIARDCGAAGALILPGRTDAVPDFLAALDLFVLPSLWEGMPLSLLEAMAMGAPVVATDTPGALEILGESGTRGIVVRRDDDVALAGAVASVLREPERAAALARAGLAHARREHDLSRLFPRLTAVYDEVLEPAAR